MRSRVPRCILNSSCMVTVPIARCRRRETAGVDCAGHLQWDHVATSRTILRSPFVERRSWRACCWASSRLQPCRSLCSGSRQACTTSAFWCVSARCTCGDRHAGIPVPPRAVNSVPDTAACHVPSPPRLSTWDRARAGCIEASLRQLCGRRWLECRRHQERRPSTRRWRSSVAQLGPLKPRAARRWCHRLCHTSCCGRWSQVGAGLEKRWPHRLYDGQSWQLPVRRCMTHVMAHNCRLRCKMKRSSPGSAGCWAHDAAGGGKSQSCGRMCMLGGMRMQGCGQT